MIENIPANIWTKQDLSEYQIFDVRTPLEWEEGVLANVECIWLYDNKGFLNENFLDEFQTKRNKDKKIAFICRSGYRSMMAAQLVQERLNLDSANLDGGMLAFQGN
ncbi:rhodanese-like domain-containing protein [Campylobacter estrildidarum]|uniref:Rhodanese n=1 Tax=Campylobacter estrildidarum TaxID=2510189 RepID=A0A4U7BJS1_9BACT|nr:rhodanese-like domain-containing protein [Campylobacter estrildidarum]TKX32143.1 rhodanese [Campylobacter estrildidarum]